MVIRMRHTKSHTRNRRSHHKAPLATLAQGVDTDTTHQRHRLCTKTGMYRGKKIIDTTKRVSKAHAKVAETETKSAA